MPLSFRSLLSAQAAHAACSQWPRPLRPTFGRHLLCWRVSGILFPSAATSPTAAASTSDRLDLIKRNGLVRVGRRDFVIGDCKGPDPLH